MPTSKKVQPVELDQQDRQMLQILSSNGRISNADLAAALDLAPSTTLMRLRRLMEQGVIQSFSADISPSAIGLELQALISVTLRAGARANLADFRPCGSIRKLSKFSSLAGKRILWSMWQSRILMKFESSS